MLTSRPFKNEEDLRSMRALLMEARRRTGDWHYAHVGELMWNFFMVACHLDPREHVRLWHENGNLAGYAILGEDPSIDWQILPAYEGSGIEDEVMAWAESRLAELRRRDADSWAGNLGSGVRADDPRRIAFLERHGFKYCGDFAEVNMLRSLDEPEPEPTVPAGYVVRAIATSEEAAARAAAQREVWRPWSCGNVTEDDYKRLMQLPGYDPDLDIVAVAADGTIAAYVNGWVDPVNKIGDFGPVGAVPAHRRRGLTRAVLLECLRRMKARGMDRVCVSTGVSNEAARKLYESVGFRVVNRYLDYVKPISGQ